MGVEEVKTIKITCDDCGKSITVTTTTFNNRLPLDWEKRNNKVLCGTCKQKK